MEKLGISLQKGSSGIVDIQQTLDKLHADWSKLDKLWISRKERLEQEVELQRLNQEGDRIEAALSGHEARLRVSDVGVRMIHSSCFTGRLLIDRDVWHHVSDSNDDVFDVICVFLAAGLSGQCPQSAEPTGGAGRSPESFGPKSH